MGADHDDAGEGSEVVVSALAINVTVPEQLRWTDERRGTEFLLTSLNVRLLPDGHLAAKAYGRPTGGAAARTRPSACRTGPSCGRWSRRARGRPVCCGRSIAVWRDPAGADRGGEGAHCGALVVAVILRRPPP